MENVKVIFDNGGGTTLVLGDYVHYYNDPVDAANDYLLYQREGNTDGWDNDEPEMAEYTDEDVRNGGVHVMDAEDIKDALSDSDFYTGWSNVQEFLGALKSPTRA